MAMSKRPFRVECYSTRADIKERIESVRSLANRVSVSQLRKWTGIHDQTIINFRSGRNTPAVDNFLLIESALEGVEETEASNG